MEIGYVYVMKESVSHTYKIGKTKNLKQRIDRFITKLPFTTEVVHLIETLQYDSLEKMLHFYFSSKRVNGEWFRLTEKDLEWLKKGDYSALFNMKPTKKKKKEVKVSTSLSSSLNEEISNLSKKMNISKSKLISEILSNSISNQNLLRELEAKYYPSKISHTIFNQLPSNFVLENDEKNTLQSSEVLEEELYERAKEFVINSQTVSNPELQSYFKISNKKATEIMNKLEQERVISSLENSQTIRVLIKNEEEPFF